MEAGQQRGRGAGVALGIRHRLRAFGVDARSVPDRDDCGHPQGFRRYRLHRPPGVCALRDGLGGAALFLARPPRAVRRYRGSRDAGALPGAAVLQPVRTERYHHDVLGRRAVHPDVALPARGSTAKPLCRLGNPGPDVYHQGKQPTCWWPSLASSHSWRRSRKFCLGCGGGRLCPARARR